MLHVIGDHNGQPHKTDVGLPGPHTRRWVFPGDLTQLDPPPGTGLTQPIDETPHQTTPDSSLLPHEQNRSRFRVETEHLPVAQRPVSQHPPSVLQ